MRRIDELALNADWTGFTFDMVRRGQWPGTDGLFRGPTSVRARCVGFLLLPDKDHHRGIWSERVIGASVTSDQGSGRGDRFARRDQGFSGADHRIETANASADKNRLRTSASIDNDKSAQWPRVCYSAGERLEVGEGMLSYAKSVCERGRVFGPFLRYCTPWVRGPKADDGWNLCPGIRPVVF